jgi:hypothetical protein
MSADLLTKEGIELELAQVQRRFDELALESNAVQNRLTEIQQEQQGLRGQHAMLQTLPRVGWWSDVRVGRGSAARTSTRGSRAGKEAA